MIIGRMTSRFDAKIFNRQGYSSSKPSKMPPDKAPGWSHQKLSGLFLFLGFLVLVLVLILILFLPSPLVSGSANWD
jgi:hypothetical protein